MNVVPKTIRGLVLVTLIGLSAVMPAHGQTSEIIISSEPAPATTGTLGTIFGVIRDRTGKDLPAVEVRALVAEREIAKIQAETSGDFVMNDLPLDQMITIRASAPFYYQDGVCVRRLCSIEPRATVRMFMRSAGGIEGRILNEAGKRVAGAKVWTDQQTTRSGQTGDFTLMNLPVGEHTVYATAPGYSVAFISKIHVAPGRMTSEVELKLQRGVNVKGRVVRAAAGKESGVPGVTVVASLGFAAVTTTTTGSNGSFSFEHLNRGSMFFKLKKGMLASELAAETTATEPLVVRLPAGATARGVVVGKGGAPVERAKITLKPDTLASDAWAVTSDAAGLFSIGDLDDKLPYMLTIEADGYAPRFERIAIGGFQSALRYELKESGGFTGQVMHGDTRVPAIDFTVVAALANGMTWKTKTNAAGEFRFEQLANGSYCLGGSRGAYSDGKNQNPQPMTAEPRINFVHAYGEWEKVELRAWPANAVAGLVKDARETPIPAATVTLEHEVLKTAPAVLGIPEFALRASGTTDASGRYRIDFVHRGVLEARAHKEGFVMNYPSHMELYVADPSARPVDPASAPKVIDTRFGQTLDFNLTLKDAADDPNEAIEVTEGQVLDAEHKPVVGIEVQRSWQMPGMNGIHGQRVRNSVVTVMTDEDGRFMFEARRYDPSRSGQIAVRPTRDMPYYGQGLNNGVLMVQRCGEIRGVVMDADGKAAGEVRVYLMQRNRDLLDSLPEQSAQAVTDNEGNFKFEMVQPGTYRVQTGQASYGSAVGNSVECEIKPGETKELKLGK